MAAGDLISRNGRTARPLELRKEATSCKWKLRVAERSREVQVEASSCGKKPRVASGSFELRKEATSCKSKIRVAERSRQLQRKLQIAGGDLPPELIFQSLLNCPYGFSIAF